MKNIISGFVLAGILHVHSDSSGAEPVTPLEPMVISATRWETFGVPTASSITVITRDEIVESGAINIIDVLKGRGGVQIRDFYGDGSRARADMRGFGDTGGFNTLILVDGRRLNNTDLHDPDLNFISIKDVERIEIIQGSASVLYGDQAVGGVINIITRQPDEFEAEIQAGYGSYDRQFQMLKFADKFKSGTGVRLTLERRRADNYRDNNKLDYLNGYFRLSHEWTGGQIFATLQRTGEEIGIPGDLLISQLYDSPTQTDTPLDFNDTQSGVFHGGGSFSLSPAWDVAAEFTHRNEDVNAVITFFGAPFALSQKRLNKSFSPRLRGRFSFNEQELFLTGGADFEDIDYSLESDFGVTASTRNMQSLYALATIPIAEVVDLTGGVRKSWVEDDIVDTFAAPAGTTLKDSQTVSSIGIIIRPTDTMRLFLKREENFRSPLIDEQTSVVGFQPPLETQTGISYEAGVEWHNHWWTSKLVGYRLHVENELIFNPVTFLNSNLDPTLRTGVIIELGAFPLNKLSLGVQYTFTDARFDEGPFRGNRIPLVAEHQLHLGLTWRFRPDWSLFGEMLFLSDQAAGNDFTDQFPGVPGYATGNMHLRFDNGRYNFSAGISNVLNTHYRESAAVNFFGQTGYYPAPERNFLVSFAYDFN